MKINNKYTDKEIKQKFIGLKKEFLILVIESIENKIEQLSKIIDGEKKYHPSSLFLIKVISIISEILYLKNEQGLYFLCNGEGLIKIGKTKNLEERVKQIEKNTGFKIKIISFHPNMSHNENLLHKKFKKDLVQFKQKDGTLSQEWFKKTEYLEKFIKNYGK